MNANDGVHYNKKHKDTLFRKLFGENKENALSLYNAVNGTNYTNAKDLEFTTLGDVIYMKMKNDISFLFDKYLSLYEHQSTLNPNMPLRGFLYFGDLYRQLISETERLYGTRMIKLPAPKYIVFYNGTKKLEGGRKELHLSDAFHPLGVSEGFEWTATVIDINYDSNADIVKKCPILSDYVRFIAKIRELSQKISDSGKAIDEAVEYCIQNDILREFLEKHRREVKNMCLTEFDEERYGQLMREEGWEDGHAKGIEQGKAEGQLHGIIETCEEMAVPIKDTIAMISKRLGVSLEDAQALYEQYKTQN